MAIVIYFLMNIEFLEDKILVTLLQYGKPTWTWGGEGEPQSCRLI